MITVQSKILFLTLRIQKLKEMKEKEEFKKLEYENENLLNQLRELIGNPKIGIKDISSIQSEISAQLIHNTLMNSNFLTIFPQLTELAERIVS